MNFDLVDELHGAPVIIKQAISGTHSFVETLEVKTAWHLESTLSCGMPPHVI